MQPSARCLAKDAYIKAAWPVSPLIQILEQLLLSRFNIGKNKPAVMIFFKFGCGIFAVSRRSSVHPRISSIAREAVGAFAPNGKTFVV